jgi:hypothetical protein
MGAAALNEFDGKYFNLKVIGTVHENSVDLSSTTNPKPIRGHHPTTCTVPAQVNLCMNEK